jgi:hypothetical protein
MGCRSLHSKIEDPRDPAQFQPAAVTRQNAPDPREEAKEGLGIGLRRARCSPSPGQDHGSGTFDQGRGSGDSETDFRAGLAILNCPLFGI